MSQPVPTPEDREQQAAVTRLLLYYLNAPIAEGCQLREVLPAPGSIRIRHLGVGNPTPTLRFALLRGGEVPLVFEVLEVVEQLYLDDSRYRSPVVGDLL
ncbi:hypothetical protein [Streptomyces sp. NPDC002619]|uniref:hypothetical protein n=1 Tax=Streptomyces sp. NPDC002619 TaxID=3364655 RepID=UPI0036A9A529